MCRNFQRGNCRKTESECRFRHVYEENHDKKNRKIEHHQRELNQINIVDDYQKNEIFCKDTILNQGKTIQDDVFVFLKQSEAVRQNVYSHQVFKNSPQNSSSVG